LLRRKEPSYTRKYIPYLDEVWRSTLGIVRNGLEPIGAGDAGSRHSLCYGDLSPIINRFDSNKSMMTRAESAPVGSESDDIRLSLNIIQAPEKETRTRPSQHHRRGRASAVGGVATPRRLRRKQQLGKPTLPIVAQHQMNPHIKTARTRTGRTSWPGLTRPGTRSRKAFAAVWLVPTESS
jgi:hypothetical protein